MLDAINQRIECAIPGIDASLEIGCALTLFLPESRCNPIIFGQIKIDDLDGSRRATVALRRALHQPARHVSGFGQEEQADLRNVCSGRNVDEIVLRLYVERVHASKLEERFVHVLEIPGIAEFNFMEANLCLRGHSPDVIADDLCQR